MVSDFQDLGGEATVQQVVDRFYQLVLGDEALAPYFDDVDLPAVKRRVESTRGQIVSA